MMLLARPSRNGFHGFGTIDWLILITPPGLVLSHLDSQATARTARSRPNKKDEKLRLLGNQTIKSIDQIRNDHDFHELKIKICIVCTICTFEFVRLHLRKITAYSRKVSTPKGVASSLARSKCSWAPFRDPELAKDPKIGGGKWSHSDLDVLDKFKS